jgi:hypothetical protein
MHADAVSSRREWRRIVIIGGAKCQDRNLRFHRGG